MPIYKLLFHSIHLTKVLFAEQLLASLIHCVADTMRCFQSLVCLSLFVTLHWWQLCRSTTNSLIMHIDFGTNRTKININIIKNAANQYWVETPSEYGQTSKCRQRCRSGEVRRALQLQLVQLYFFFFFLLLLLLWQFTSIFLFIFSFS